MSSPKASATGELRVLDGTGCLTLEVLGFVDQLRPEQQQAVQRHVRCCSTCAQGYSAISLAAERIRRARPRMRLPTEVGLLAWQVALRSLALRRQQIGPQIRKLQAFPAPAKLKVRAWHGTWMGGVLLGSGLLLAAILALIALLLLSSGCNEQDSSDPPSKLRLGQLQSEPRFSAALTAAASGPQGQLAAGTAEGEILLGRETKTVTSLPAKEVHQGPITGLAFTADGKQLVSAGGKVLALWQLDGGKLVRQLRGPQQISALAIDPPTQLAYFGTSEGHVLRWALKTSSAEAVAGFSCAGSVVDPPRLQLVAEKRCPYGTYVEPESGPAMCAYPVTALTLSQGRLIRSCREGTVGVLWLASGRRDYYLAGHLGALAALGDGSLFFGRTDGELRIYDPKEKQVLTQLAPRGAPAAVAAAADGNLLAVAHTHTLRIFQSPHPQPLATVRLPARAIWLELDRQRGQLRLLTGAGKLLTASLRLEPAAAKRR